MFVVGTCLHLSGPIIFGDINDNTIICLLCKSGVLFFMFNTLSVLLLLGSVNFSIFFNYVVRFRFYITICNFFVAVPTKTHVMTVLEL